jgi:hypothetical protein
MSFTNYKVKESEMINTLNERVFTDDHINKTIDEFDKVDCHNKLYTLELKFRNMPSDRYNDCFLEKAKYDALIERAKIKNKKAGYIAAYSCGSYYAWNLSELTDQNYEFNWEQNFMKKTTHFTNNNQVSKLSCKLPLTKGKKII